LTTVNFSGKVFRLTRKLQPSYDLRHVQSLIRQGKYLVKDNALGAAYDDFGWTGFEIQEVMCKLKPKHFRKSAPSQKIPGIMIDYYAVRKIKGESVYLHFYVTYEGSDELVIINSFHRLEERV